MVNVLNYNTPTYSPFNFAELWIKDCDTFFISQLFENAKAMTIEKDEVIEVIWDEYSPRNFNKIINESIVKEYILNHFFIFLKNIQDVVYINLYTPNMLYRIKVRHKKLYFRFFKSDS